MSFSELARKYAPWSMSKAESANQCGFRYNLQNVQKVRAQVKEASPERRIGIAAHSIIEKILKEDPTDIKKTVFRETTVQKLASKEVDEVMALLHNMYAFKERVDAYKVKLGVTNTLVEHHFSLSDQHTESASKTDVFLRGVMDLFFQTADGYTVVIDHKTGTPSPDIWDRHGNQLKLYSIAALALVPDMKATQFAIHYIQTGEIKFYESKMSAEYIREKIIPWYVGYINEAAVAAQAAVAKKGWYCNFCEYTPSCPLK